MPTDMNARAPIPADVVDAIVGSIDWHPTVIGGTTHEQALVRLIIEGYLRRTAVQFDVRMERPTAPNWGGEEDDNGNQLWHHAWDATDGALRLWVGPYAACAAEPSWAVTVRGARLDLVMRCTPHEVVEWADMVKAAVVDSPALCGVVIDLQGLGEFPCVIEDDGEPGAHDGDCVTQPERDGTWPPPPVAAPRPTREQVDAALAFADRHWVDSSHTCVLAAEVRGQRDELITGSLVIRPGDHVLIGLSNELDDAGRTALSKQLAAFVDSGRVTFAIVEQCTTIAAVRASASLPDPCTPGHCDGCIPGRDGEHIAVPMWPNGLCEHTGGPPA